MPTLTIPRDGEGKPYRIKVGGVRIGNHMEYYSKQLGHVASRKMHSSKVICFVHLKGFDSDNARIVATKREGQS